LIEWVYLYRQYVSLPEKQHVESITKQAHIECAL